MSVLREKLESVSETFEALLTGRVTVLEIFECAKAVGDVVREVEPAGTAEQYEALLLEGWDWADEKYQLVEKADEAIKFPVWLAPAEAFDGPGISYLAKRVIIPQLAIKLAETVG